MRKPSRASGIALLVFASGCEMEAPRDAGVDVRPPRDASPSMEAGCLALTCGEVLGFVTGSGAPPGMGPGGGDPCDPNAMMPPGGGGPMNISFCDAQTNAAVQAVVGCLMSTCADSCALFGPGGGPVCDAGAAAARDAAASADAAAPGSACRLCLTARCPTEVRTCETR